MQAACGSSFQLLSEAEHGFPAGQPNRAPCPLWKKREPLVAQTVKNPPAVRETWVPSLGQEDPLEKVMVTHSSILAWRIPWTEEPGGLQSMGLESQT